MDNLKETIARALSGDNAQPVKSNDENNSFLPPTKEELDALIKASTDAAIKTAQEEWNKKLEAEKSEIERIAKMTPQEREEELQRQREADLVEREKTINQKELESKTIDLLKAKQLPVDFMPFVISSDEASTMDKIEKLNSLHQGKSIVNVNGSEKDESENIATIFRSALG